MALMAMSDRLAFPFRSRFLLGCFLVRVSYTFVAVIEVLYVSALTFVYEVIPCGRRFCSDGHPVYWVQSAFRFSTFPLRSIIDRAQLR